MCQFKITLMSIYPQLSLISAKIWLCLNKYTYSMSPTVTLKVKFDYQWCNQ